MGGEVSSMKWGGSRNWTGSWDGSMGEGGEDRSWGALHGTAEGDPGGGPADTGGGVNTNHPGTIAG